MTLSERFEWQDQAACRGKGHLMELGDHVLDRRRPTTAKTAAQLHEARQLCFSCPVRPQCRQWVETGDSDPVPAHVAAGSAPWERRGNRPVNVDGVVVGLRGVIPQHGGLKLARSGCECPPCVRKRDVIRQGRAELRRRQRARVTA